MSTARLQVLLAAVLFGTTGTALALGPAGASALTVGAARVLVGGVLLVGVALAGGGLRRRSGWPVGLVLVAGAGVAVYQVAFFEAVDRTGVGIGAVVAIGSGPVLAGLFERVVDGIWPGRTWAVATVLATAGVAVLTLAATGDDALSVVGIGLALVSGAGYAGYTVIAKQLLRRGHGAIETMGAAFGAGALLLLPVLLLGDTAWLATPEGVALALYLGVVPTALAYVLFARGLRRLSAAEVTTIVLAEPLTAMALGAIVLDERIGVAGAVGAALVLAGLTVLARPSRRPDIRTVEVAP